MMIMIVINKFGLKIDFKIKKKHQFFLKKYIIKFFLTNDHKLKINLCVLLQDMAVVTMQKRIYHNTYEAHINFCLIKICRYIDFNCLKKTIFGCSGIRFYQKLLFLTHLILQISKLKENKIAR